ncbi:MAG: hypothetical protein ABIA74_04860 [bacterium]
MKLENKAVIKVFIILGIVIVILALIGWIYYPVVKALIVKKIMGQVATPKGIVTGLFRKIF